MCVADTVRLCVGERHGLIGTYGNKLHMTLDLMVCRNCCIVPLREDTIVCTQH